MSIDPDLQLLLHHQDAARTHRNRATRAALPPRTRRRRTGAPRLEWPAPDADSFRALLGMAAEPVVIVTGRDDVGLPRGMTVSSFSSASLTPPLVLFCVGVRSSTWAAIAGQGRFAITMLGRGERDLADRFASPVDRFAGVPHDDTPDGTPVLSGGLATLLCDIEDGLRAGDHDVVVGRVVGARTLDPDGRPLAYNRGRYASVAALPATTGGAS